MQPAQRARWLLLLGLAATEDHTPAEIRSAYHKQALRFHPDKNPSPDAADQFKRIHEAFEGLFYQSTPAQREGEGSDCDLFSDELPGALHRDWVAADHGRTRRASSQSRPLFHCGGQRGRPATVCDAAYAPKHTGCK